MSQDLFQTPSQHTYSQDSYGQGEATPAAATASASSSSSTSTAFSPGISLVVPVYTPCPTGRSSPLATSATVTPPVPAPLATGPLTHQQDVASHQCLVAARMCKLSANKVWEGSCYLHKVPKTPDHLLSRAVLPEHVSRIKTSLRANPFIFNSSIVLHKAQLEPGSAVGDATCYGPDIVCIGGNHTMEAVKELVTEFQDDIPRYSWRPVVLYANLAEDDVVWFSEELNKANSIHRGGTEMQRLFTARDLLDAGLFNKNDTHLRSKLGSRWGWTQQDFESMPCAKLANVKKNRSPTVFFDSCQFCPPAQSPPRYGFCFASPIQPSDCCVR